MGLSEENVGQAAEDLKDPEVEENPKDFEVTEGSKDHEQIQIEHDQEVEDGSNKEDNMDIVS